MSESPRSHALAEAWAEFEEQYLARTPATAYLRTVLRAAFYAGAATFFSKLWRATRDDKEHRWPTCPACGQPVEDDEAMRGELEGLLEEIEHYARDLNQLDDDR
jgi:hypothetical protein